MVNEEFIPQKGDIVWLQFDPASGHEQQGRRPALVISGSSFNMGIFALIFPITSRIKDRAFEVEINTEEIKGVVLCDQPKSVDWRSRGEVKFATKCPEDVFEKAVSFLLEIISSD